MAPSLALSKSEVLARNLATSLSYPELPRLSGALEGNLDLPDQSQALDAAVVLHVYHLLITAYHGGRRFLPQLNEYALHAAWSHLCSKLASLSPAPGDNLQVRSALLPGEAADRLGINPAADTPTSSPARKGAGSKGSPGSRVGPEGIEDPAARPAGASAPPPATSASSALNQVNYRHEGFVEAKDLARGRIEVQVEKVAGKCNVIRGAHELKDNLAIGLRKTVYRVKKELLALFVTNVKLGSPQRHTYIFLTDATLAIVYCLKVHNYNKWQLEDGYDKIYGCIMRSRVLRIDWGNPKAFQNPPTYDSLVAVAYMIRCFVPELSRLSLQQVQVAAAKVLTLDASQSFKSVRETLTFAVEHVRAAESAEAREEEEYAQNARMLSKRKADAEDEQAAAAAAAEEATADATAKMLSSEDQMLKRVVGAGARFAGKIMPEVIEGYISMLELHLQSMREFKQEAEGALLPRAQLLQQVDRK